MNETPALGGDGDAVESSQKPKRPRAGAVSTNPRREAWQQNLESVPARQY